VTSCRSRRQPTRSAIAEITHDMRRSRPPAAAGRRRLGQTIVAFAALLTAGGGYRCASPTEVLAEQHYPDR
jgi:RecG-like helicase